MTSRFRLLPMIVFLLVATALCSWSYPIVCNWAYPTIYGDTGLVQIPTVDTVPYLDADFAIDYTRVSDTQNSPQANAVPIRLNYGIAPSTEIFGFFCPTDNENAFNAFGGGVKAVLYRPQETSWTPGLAIGARVIGQEDTLSRTTIDAYLVSSIPLFRYAETTDKGYRVRTHLGLDVLNFNGDNDGTFVSGFAGLSFESNFGTSVVLDYVPQIEDNGVEYRASTISGAIRLPLSQEFSLELGGTRPFATGDMSFYGGVMYHIGPNDEESRLPTVEY